eukprot:NODE_824_length_1756_cov_33.110721_g676_i0.p1 GENE.NODE_824_length_1756_cov_33.110721_g676_i0~~NODE_824_length_1756_cov_33.110721_g676_i0.p1  ORF type:complete len:508 (-),score=114.65 NODE_824_length_1756_cov_33.110721_g676_i0:63-1586(-)
MEDAGIGDITSSEKDGICISFYHYLWLKPNKRVKGVVVEGNAFKLNIPDTIVYNFQKPQFWYFTSRAQDPNERGTIRHKKRFNLNSQKILEHFLRPKSRSGIVAMLITRRDARDEEHGGAQSHPPPAGDAGDNALDLAARVASHQFQRSSGIETRYLDEQSLRMHVERCGVTHGVVQQFVDPKPAHDGVVRNSIIQVNWQPNHTSFERRENKHPLFRKHPDEHPGEEELQRRGQTFEGTYRNSEPSPLVSGIVLDELTRTSNMIAQHFRHVSDYTVRKMVLNFKIDAHGTIWFLYCSSISVVPFHSFVPRPHLDPTTSARDAAAIAGKQRQQQKGLEKRRAAAMEVALGNQTASRKGNVFRPTQSAPEGIDKWLASACTRSTLKRLVADQAGAQAQTPSPQPYHLPPMAGSPANRAGAATAPPPGIQGPGDESPLSAPRTWGAKSERKFSTASVRSHGSSNPPGADPGNSRLAATYGGPQSDVPRTEEFSSGTWGAGDTSLKRVLPH